MWERFLIAYEGTLVLALNVFNDNLILI